MKPADVCIAVLVAVVWGLGFVASRLVLDELPPMLMTALRFTIAATPCLVVRRPKVSWTILIAISFTLFIGQFVSQSYGIKLGVPVGLASVIVQSQALFTIAFAAFLFREVPSGIQLAGIAVAAVGLLMICGTVGHDFTVGAFAIMLLSPVCFALGNILLRQAHGVPMFDLFAWLSFTAALPLLVLAVLTDGVAPIWHSLTHVSLQAVLCMLALGGITTSFAYWLWGRLLRDNPAAHVVPFALLVPFVGAGASAIVFQEKFGALRLAGMLTVIGGIAVMLLARRLQAVPRIA
jgi:O-acetylserine/cysteine efflux transporter